MENLQIEESPGRTTSGLTSASQLINTTDAVSFEPSNTSSAIPEQVIAEPEPSENLKCTQPTDIFREALRRTVRRQRKVLDKLSKL